MNSRFRKDTIKTVSTGNNRHRKEGKKDILVLSSAQSGPIWFMDILYTKTKINYIF